MKVRAAPSPFAFLAETHSRGASAVVGSAPIMRINAPAR